MKLRLRPKHGFLIKSSMKLLGYFASPLDWIHRKLKNQFRESTFIEGRLKHWSKDDREGLFIELWALFWTIVNIFLIIGIAESTICLSVVFGFLMCLRAADFLSAFLAMNLNLIPLVQRSLARSYAMLFLAFFEVAAILTSFQFLICKHFFFGCSQATWSNAFYYSLRNMLTVGGGDINPSPLCCDCTGFMFAVIRVAQPLFSVLLVTLAISQTINYKKNPLNQRAKRRITLYKRSKSREKRIPVSL